MELALHEARQAKQQRQLGDAPADPNQLHPNGEQRAGWLSRWLFLYVNPILERGARAPLQFRDLQRLPPAHDAAAADAVFQPLWAEELRRPAPSLFRCALRCSPEYPRVSVPFDFCYSVIMGFSPLILRGLVDYVSDPAEAGLAQGLGYAALLLLPSAINALLAQRASSTMNKMSVRLRGALVGAIYRKALRLSPAAQARYTTGEITNLVTVDAQRFVDYAFFANWWFKAPTVIAIVLCLLVREVGWAALPAFVLMAALVFGGRRLAARVIGFEQQRSRASDKRMRAVTETVSHMAVVKMYSWCKSAIATITALREDELTHLYHILRVKNTAQVTLASVDYVVAATLFAFYLIVFDDGASLTPGRTFTALALVYAARLPLIIMPTLVPALGQLRVSFANIQRFLLAEERAAAVERGPATVLEDASFSWGNGAGDVLSLVSLRVEPGELVAVVGPVGAGKSSLLSALAGDVQRTGGRLVLAEGRLAYVVQRPWIVGGTIRDNVVMGAAFDADLFARTCHACALDGDFAQMPDGELTEIGERGVTLSGGQMARVALARAVYAQADVYLLDDVLSALDAHVARHVLEECVVKMLAGRTRVLATHMVAAVERADRVVTVAVGGVVSSSSLVEQAAVAVSSFAADAPEEEDDDDKAPAKVLVQKEERETGAVKWQVLKRYVLLGVRRPALLLLFPLIFAVEGGSRLLTDAYLNVWTRAYSESDDADVDDEGYLATYGLLAVGALAAQALRCACMVLALVSVSRGLHAGLLETVVRAPMALFDSTPQGRLTSRFARDMVIVDILLPNNLNDFIGTSLQLLITLTVAGVAFPWVLPCFFALMLSFRGLAAYYRATARELQACRPDNPTTHLTKQSDSRTSAARPSSPSSPRPSTASSRSAPWGSPRARASASSACSTPTPSRSTTSGWWSTGAAYG